MSITILIQVWLLCKSRRKLVDIKEYAYDRPTYNVLTIFIVKALQVMLVLSIISTSFRCLFFFLSGSYLNVVLHNNYDLYFVYQLVMVLVPSSIEYVYTCQIFEWMAMLFVIVTQKDRRIEEILFDQ
jgi:hypothetical protein